MIKIDYLKGIVEGYWRKKVDVPLAVFEDMVELVDACVTYCHTETVEAHDRMQMAAGRFVKRTA